jgi:hypothetical protein
MSNALAGIGSQSVGVLMGQEKLLNGRTFADPRD